MKMLSELLQLFFLLEFEDATNSYGEVFKTNCKSSKENDWGADNLDKEAILSISSDLINTHIIQLVIGLGEYVTALFCELLRLILGQEVVLVQEFNESLNLLDMLLKHN